MSRFESWDIDIGAVGGGDLWLAETASHRVYVPSVWRFGLLVVALASGLLLLFMRMAWLAEEHEESPPPMIELEFGKGQMTRGVVTDRHGTVLATNVATASIYVHPKQLLDPPATARALARIFPEWTAKALLSYWETHKNFAWIKRHATPLELKAVNDLGMIGVEYQQGQRRLYPHDSLFSHVLGYVDVDGHGLAAMEKALDASLRLKAEGRPVSVALSVDLPIQHIVHEELKAAMVRHQAIGAIGVMMDIQTGEVLSMVSLPDFNPHDPMASSDHARFNQAALGIHEVGSIFKPIMIAIALESKVATVHDRFDVSEPLRVASYRITDMHPFQGSLTLPEVFMHSSNIGMAKIGLAVGSQQQSEYLKRFGLLQPVAMELPEKGRPWYPSAGQWTQLSSITISYGHGISVSPLHMVRTTAGLLSDQGMPEMTFLKRAPGATVHRETIVSPMTAAWMRSMFRYNTLEGTGRKGRAQGYLVGAKTGTAHKSLGSRGYSKDKITSFIGAFPIHDPKVVLLVMLDSPKPTKETFGFATGGWTAAPVFKKIVMRAAPLLSIPPVVEEDPQWEKQFLALPITPKSEGRRT